MKSLLAICLFLVTTLALATDAMAPAADSMVKGKVLEVREVENYTYLRLQTSTGETWAAVGKSPVKKGSEVTVHDAMVMKNFESKALHKTFDSIVFGSLASGALPATSPHGASAVTPVAAADIHVPRAAGANARSVAEINTKAAELKDKTVLLHAQVVKFTPEIMGKNWIHLQDGTGSASDKSNDILLTSANQVKTGDVVTFKGIVRLDRDFGAGYAYKVIIEEAVLQP